MTIGPAPWKTVSIAAVATRSSGACWIWFNGNMHRYARLARMYKTVTSTVPGANASGKLRRGFFTSPAMKVTLFHASDEKSDPTWATQNAMNNPKAPSAAVTVGMKERYGWIGETPCGVQRLEKLVLMTAAFRPITSPITINRISESVLAEVKIF